MIKKVELNMLPTKNKLQSYYYVEVYHFII